MLCGNTHTHSWRGIGRGFVESVEGEEGGKGGVAHKECGQDSGSCPCGGERDLQSCHCLKACGSL